MNELINVLRQDGNLVVSSREVARNFGKNHQHVLRDVDDLKRGVQNWTGLFIPSSYKHEQNKQEYREYLLTRDGFTLLAMGFTGKKALEWKLKYIEAFNKMEQTLTIGLQSLSPELQMFRQIFNAVAKQELEVKQIKAQNQQVMETTQNIKDTIVGVYDDWRDWVRQTVSKIQKGSGMTYQDVYSTLYDQLERRAKCRLSVRVDNQRKRMALDGATKTKIESYRTLDAIEDDQRLREIFSTIVKEYAIKYVA
jgi:Rha family phage regulatory protein